MQTIMSFFNCNIADLFYRAVIVNAIVFVFFAIAFINTSKKYITPEQIIEKKVGAIGFILYGVLSFMLILTNYMFLPNEPNKWLLSLLFKLLVMSIMIIMAMIDWCVRKIPNKLAVYLSITGLPFLLLMPQFVVQRLVLIGIITIICVLIAIITPKIGGGDLKMFIALAFSLSVSLYITSFVWTSIIAIAFIGIGLITKKINLKSFVPFAPFMLVGVFITLCINYI